MYMELNTIIELVKAGFTKDEIVRMEQPATQIPVTEPVQMEMDLPVPEAEPIPAQVAEPTPTPQPVPTPAPVIPQEEKPSTSDLMKEIAKLTSAIQANAIAQSVIPSQMQKSVSAEDIMAEIIRPTYGGKN